MKVNQTTWGLLKSTIDLHKAIMEVYNAFRIMEQHESYMKAKSWIIVLHYSIQFWNNIKWFGEFYNAP